MKVQYLVLCGLLALARGDDFPSLLTANASMAIILDREYLDANYDSLLADVKVIIEKVLREDLKNGGLYVTYYSWTNVNLKRDYMAVFSVTNCKETWQVFDKAREDSLLHIALTDADCPRLPPTEAIMIPVINKGEELPQIVYDLKSIALRWKSVVILHDESFNRDTISRVAIAATSESPHGYIPAMSASLFKLKAHIQEWERKKSLRRTLLNLPTRFIGTNFLVIVNMAMLETIMETAKDLNMVNSESMWLYVVSDTSAKKDNISQVAPLIGEGENVAFVFNISNFGPECQFGYACHSRELIRGFVLALSRIIREETAIYGQISDEEWETIRLTKRERLDSMLDIINIHLKNSTICSKCTSWKIQAGEFWGSSYEATEERYTSNNVVQEDWSLTKLGKQKAIPKLTEVGAWRPNDGVTLSDALFPHVSFGFRNKNIHIITYHNPPWQIITYNESGVPGELKGLVIDILNELSKKLNFTYTLHIIPVFYAATNVSDDSGFNVTDEMRLPTINIPNEILNIVGQNKILLAAVGSTITDKYRNKVNYTIPISVQSYNFIVSRPRELSRLYLFMAPFTTDTWLCLLACIVLMGPFLYIINRLSPFYEHKGIKFEKTGLHKIHNCFWYVYGALLQQGGMYLPQADSGRIIIGTWWLVVIVLVTTYCGNLVAFLTFPKIDIPITTINELVRQTNGITWSTRSGSFLEDYMRNSDEPKYNRLLRGSDFTKDVTPEIIQKVRTGKHIYIDWKSNLQYIMKKEFLVNDRCDFSLGIDDFIDERIAVVMPENSPYLNLINGEIKRMHQMGFIDRWLKEYLPKRDRCWNVGKIEVSNHTVNLDDMQGSFLVLIIGCFIGLMTICCEFVWKKRASLKEQTVIKPFVK